MGAIKITLCLVGLVSLFFVGAAYAALGFMVILGIAAIVALVVISITNRERTLCGTGSSRNQLTELNRPH
jgi:hypothetical protein